MEINSSSSINKCHHQSVTAFFLLIFCSFSVIQGFSVIPRVQYHSLSSKSVPMTTTTALSSSDFTSDFGSAMPPKPELSLEEKMNESADVFVINMMAALTNDDGVVVEAPPELDALKVLRENKASTEDIALKIYELMIERAMLYDDDPGNPGKLLPTCMSDISPYLEIPQVKQEFKHLYSYGMVLMNKGLIEGDILKETVIERLIKRTGLSPDEFDKWLGY